MRASFVLFFTLATACAGGCHRSPAPARSTPSGYEKEVLQGRAERVEKLKAEGGWLRLAGLFWLRDGKNRIGSAPDGEIVLPGRAPAHVGLLELGGEGVQLVVEPGVQVFSAGKPVERMRLYSAGNESYEPIKIQLGELTFFVIERGGKLAVRLFDDRAESLTGFAGLEYFPIDQRYRLSGQYVAYPEPRKVMVSTVIQSTIEASIPGEVIFELDGRELRLLPIAEPGDEQFFFVFGDKTNGSETYGGGRFLEADVPRDGSDQVELDFNRAVNPPCAFTAYATCPIPRRENRLPIRVPAGEKRYAKPHPQHGGADKDREGP